MGEVAGLATAHLRVARPTENLDALIWFYRERLVQVLSSFTDHECEMA